MTLYLEKIFLIVIILIIISVIIQIIIKNFDKKWLINLLDKEDIKKLNDFNYDFLEIKRERDSNFIRGGYGSLIPIFKEYLEVYGIKNNKEYLIYKNEWSKNEYDELIILINNYNKK